VVEGKERVSVDFSNTQKRRRDELMMMRLKVGGFGVGLVDLTWSH
jgi:hypothetical protein